MKKNNYIYSILGALSLFVIWFCLEKHFNNSIVIPGVDKTIKTLFEMLITKKTYQILFNTISKLLITVLLSLLVALILGSLAFASYRIKVFLKPIISLTRTMPVIIIIIILWSSVSNEISPMVITSLLIVPILYEGIQSSLSSIDKNIKEEVKMISNTNINILLKVYFPIAIPYIISSLIASIGLGLKVMITSEYICMSKGTIGERISYARNVVISSCSIQEVFAWVIIIVVLIMFIESMINLFKKKYIY